MPYNRHFTDAFPGLNVQSGRVAAIAPYQDRRRTMPLLHIDVIEGRTPSEIQALLDAVHDAVVEAFEGATAGPLPGGAHPSRSRDRRLGYRSRHHSLATAGDRARGQPAARPRNEGEVL